MLHTVGDVLDELTDQLATLDVALPTSARPVRFGSWIGGDRDGNPNVTPEVTMDVLVLQHGHAIRDLTTLIDALLRGSLVLGASGRRQPRAAGQHRERHRSAARARPPR